MAYDPKSYLEQALKTGFQQAYVPPTSPESGDGTYDAPVATFGDVQVRPLMELFGQSEQDIGTPQQTGYAVSRPLKDGYFENSIFDNEGRFLRKTISEPDNDKYGLKALAQMGLMAASFGALGPMGKLISQGVSGINALKSGDPLRILGAAANIPGADSVIPADLKSLAGYVSKAGSLKSALEGDPSSIFKLVSGLDSKTPSKAPSPSETAVGGGADIYGAYDPDVEAGLMYYGSDPSEEKYAEEDRLLGKYPAPVTMPEPKTSMSPQEMARFLEANIDNPGTIETLMQEYYPDLYRQSIGVTGKKQTAPDFTEVPDRTPGVPLDTPPDEDRRAAPGPVTGGTAKLSTPSPAPASKAQSGFDPRSLMAFFAMMSPQKAAEPYQVAQIRAKSPFGTVFDSYDGQQSSMDDLLGLIGRG